MEKTVKYGESDRYNKATEQFLMWVTAIGFIIAFTAIIAA
jgi:hypothetical protein